MKYLAAEIKIGKPFVGEGPLGLEGKNPTAAGAVFGNFISKTIGIMTVVAFIWFIFVFITGAISWIGAGGDKANLENARKRIMNGLVGIVVTIAALFLFRLIGFLLGLETVLNPG